MTHFSLTSWELMMLRRFLIGCLLRQWYQKEIMGWSLKFLECKKSHDPFYCRQYLDLTNRTVLMTDFGLRFNEVWSKIAFFNTFMRHLTKCIILKVPRKIAEQQYYVGHYESFHYCPIHYIAILSNLLGSCNTEV